MKPLFDNFAAWGDYCRETESPLHQPVLEYEQSQRGTDTETTQRKLKEAYEVMRDAIHTGLKEKLSSRSGMVQGGGKKIAEYPLSVLSKEFQLLVARAIAAKEF